MPSTSETGHAKNVANFQDLISFCTGYGAAYNPSKTELRVFNLTAQHTAAKTVLSTVTTSQTRFNNATNSRLIAFKTLKPLATKTVNALDATDASVETVKDARTINRKLQGQRATPKPETPPSEPGDTPPPDTSISTSQQSYDQQIEHFSRLIDLLVSEASYSPNETDLTTAALQTKLAELQNVNTDVVQKYTEYSNSRIQRDNSLYNAVTGIVAIALDVKKYVKSVFGASSPQYKQVSKLQFRTVKS